jgi:hypothetical protein
MKGEEAGGGATKRTWRDPDKGRELTVTLARKTATDSTPRVLTNGVHPPPGYQAWEAPDAVVDTATANGLSYVRAAKEAGGAGTVLYVAFDDDTVIEIRGSYKSPDDFFLLECAVATLRRG